jgi:hypothetical protein
MKICLLLALVGLVISFTSCTTGNQGTSTWKPASAEPDYDTVYQATGVRPVSPSPSNQ